MKTLSNILAELARYLSFHSYHFLSWQAISSVQPWSLRHVTEALLIAKHRAILSKQVQAFHLPLFPVAFTSIHERCIALRPSNFAY